MASQFPFLQTYSLPPERSRAGPDLVAIGDVGWCIPREWSWRQPGQLEFANAEDAPVVASRWIDDRNCSRIECANSSVGGYVVAVAMRTTRMALSRASHTIFEGVMFAGTVYVTDSSMPLLAEFRAPCDFVHLYVSDAWLRSKRPFGASAPALDVFIARDPLAERLARSLIDLGASSCDHYAESVGQTIVMRVLGQLSEGSKNTLGKAKPLQRWRLKRVREYVTDNLSEPIGLADLAATAGLSRMHFAAQFRAATGYRPHEYLMFCRIERAKDMLANEDVPLVEVALSVGFQTQAHFTTVFKRLTNHTPAQWRRANAQATISIPVPTRTSREMAVALID